MSHQGCCTAVIALSQLRLRRYNVLIARDAWYMVLTIAQVREVLMGQTELLYPLYYVFFFAPSAVRPNSPVANEQNVTIHHLQQNKKQKPERTTAIPPARIAVLIQQKKQHQSSKTNKNPKRQKW